MLQQFIETNLWSSTPVVMNRYIGRRQTLFARFCSSMLCPYRAYNTCWAILPTTSTKLWSIRKNLPKCLLHCVPFYVPPAIWNDSYTRAFEFQGSTTTFRTSLVRFTK